MSKKSVFSAIFTVLIFSLYHGTVFAEQDSFGMVILATDKMTYLPEEFIIISGEVTERKMPLIAIRIFDPDDKILGGYNVELDENNQFSKTIIADIPFYEKPGIYRITAEYGKIESEAIFEIENMLFVDEETNSTVEETETEETEIEEPEIKPQITLFETDKKIYQNDDTISITGKVSRVSHPQVTITIFDPFNVPTGIYLADVNSDLTFSVSFLAKYNTNFKVIGEYSIAGQYGELETRQIRTIQFVEKTEVPDVNTEPIPSTEPDITSIESEVTTTEPDITDTPTTESFLFSESDLQHLASWYYLDGSDDELAHFFAELVKRDLLNPDADTVSVDLSKWIKTNNSSLGSIISDLFEGKISEEKFVSLVEDSLDNYTENTSNMIDKVSPPLIKIDDIPEIKRSEDTDSKSKTTFPEIKDEITIEPVEEKITYFHSNVNCEKGEYEDVISQYNNPGPALARLCKYEEAISYYEKTLEQDPKNVYALTNTGSALASLGRYEDAMSYYDKALESDPQYLAALNNMGNAFANIGDYQNAISYYDMVLEINSQYLPALNNKEKASVSLTVFPVSEESQIHAVSDHITEFKEQRHLTIEENKSKDIVAQFADALSSIGTSLLSLFGG